MNGVVGKPREKWQTLSERAVRQRSGGMCEWPGCRARGSDHAHGFGRGNIVAVPLCDHPTLCWRACRKHHNIYDGRAQPAVTDVATVAAFAGGIALRAWLRFLPHADFPLDAAPVEIVREIERAIQARGILRTPEEWW